jgi:hypothetical protein
MTVNTLRTTGDSCAQYGTWTWYKIKLILDVRYWHISTSEGCFIRSAPDGDQADGDYSPRRC